MSGASAELLPKQPPHPLSCACPQEWLGEDLSFQQIEAELASLPGSYCASAGGAMLLAYAADGRGDAAGGGEAVIGAVALRRLVGHTAGLAAGARVAGVPLERACEMKRLFVLAEHHGLGAGAALVRELLRAAAGRGYQSMVLDTLDRLEGANRLYRRLGFEPCERYNDCPLPGVLYFTRRLQQEGGGGGDADAPEPAS